MNYPHMLIMRNSPEGLIWQAYEVHDDLETELLTRSATRNGFIVQTEPAGYVDETTPGWRDSQEWKEYRQKYERQRDPSGVAPDNTRAHEGARPTGS